jgi:hypothetical protein
MEQIISASGVQYGLIVNSDGSINAQTDNQLPTQGDNPKWSFSYDNNGNIGSVYQMLSTGSYVNTITWVGYSGPSIGVGSRVTDISSWSVV